MPGGALAMSSNDKRTLPKLSTTFFVLSISIQPTRRRDTICQANTESGRRYRGKQRNNYLADADDAGFSEHILITYLILFDNVSVLHRFNTSKNILLVRC